MDKGPPADFLRVEDLQLVLDIENLPLAFRTFYKSSTKMTFLRSSKNKGPLTTGLL